MTVQIDATYSVEDNKLRLYASERLDDDLYARVKAAGFKWAPKQDLFVAPRWTPEREDLCIELASDITSEQTTVIERAEAKAERLETLAHKRARDANAYADAAIRISERFAGGQPILVGHHSERRARKDQERMHNAMRKSSECTKAIDYWNWRVAGVERHADRRSNPAVRARRIKTLLKELRDRQNHINHAFLCVDLWERIGRMDDGESFVKMVENYAGGQIKTGSTSSFESYYDLRDGKRQHREFVESMVESWQAQTGNTTVYRWINHILNRLAFERAELGPVRRFEGEITKVILQAFARTQGALKPLATENSDTDTWSLVTPVPLPAHVGDGNRIELDSEGFCDLMLSCGYEVPAPKARRKSTKPQVPLINPSVSEATRLQAIWNAAAIEKHGERLKTCDAVEMTQAKYSANSGGTYTNYQSIELDQTGSRIWGTCRGKSGTPVCRIRVFTGGGDFGSPVAIVALTDKPCISLPIDWPTTTECAA